jgi:hypothetical protein
LAYNWFKRRRPMRRFKLTGIILLIASSPYSMPTPSLAAERWQEGTFPPPNAGRLVFTIMDDGNPACASYDGRNCLWGKSMGDIDFGWVRPLVCGAGHRKLYGVTGFENPQHWCNLALGDRPAQTAQPAPPAQPASPLSQRCDRYAKEAVKEVQSALGNPRRCHLDRSPRWQTSYQNHYNWCLTVTPARVQAEAQERRRIVFRCTSFDPGSVNDPQ